MIMRLILTMRKRKGGKETRKWNWSCLKSIKFWAITTIKGQISRGDQSWEWAMSIWPTIAKFEDWSIGFFRGTSTVKQRPKKPMTMEFSYPNQPPTINSFRTSSKTSKTRTKTTTSKINKSIWTKINLNNISLIEVNPNQTIFSTTETNSPKRLTWIQSSITLSVVNISWRTCIRKLNRSRGSTIEYKNLRVRLSLRMGVEERRRRRVKKRRRNILVSSRKMGKNKRCRPISRFKIPWIPKLDQERK